MTEHVCKWEIRKRGLEPWPYYWFECIHCNVQLSGAKVLARLNEYDALKRENEGLNDKIAEFINGERVGTND